MANVTQTNANIYNANSNNSNNNNNKSNNDTSMSSGVSSLRDVCNFLQQPSKGQKINLQADAASYDHVVEMIRGLDLQDDGIEMNRKIKQIEIDFCNIVHNEDVLCESMEYMNNKALADPETSLKFAMLFSSRSFDALAMNDTKVRCTMLKILETNFMNAEIYRTQDRNRLYNSITMLGEYYHRVRLADNSPVKILGESLLTLLQQELTETQSVDVRLAKLILSQITLNGRLLGARHQPQMAQLFYYIRCQLIEKHTLTATVKALLLMTLDMYYSNFQNLSKDLEDLYTKYFLQGEQEEAAVQQEILNGNHTTELESPTTDATTTKKWSEQVCEESFGELEDNPWLVNNELSYSVKQPQQQTSPKEKYIKSPKQQQQPKELSEEVKPMPRWRAPRFNRESHHQDNKLKSREQFGRRLSGNYDDDEEQSVRSEGGNIRLYSINDRLKHSQEKLASSVGDNNSQHYYNAASIANSNWDRQSQRDDRSERSYMSNYERGHVHPRGRHNNNNNNKNNNNNNGNKQIYDKPPRFQKQQQQQQHQQQQQQQQQKHHHTDSWRRRWPARGNSSPRDTFDVAEREDDVQSQSSNRARTLPRPFKGNFEKSEHPQEHIASASYRRRSSQSPGQYTKSRNYRSHNNNNNNNSNHARYSSQSSLASEASSVYLKRQQQQQQHHQHKNTRNFNNNHHRNNKNGLKSDKDWSNDADNAAAGIDGEIVKNARQTTNYMNYLSQK